MARPARRVRPRLLAEVRPGLGLAGSRQAGLPAPRGAQPAARMGRPAGPRRRRPGAVRGGHERAVGTCAAGDRRALDHARHSSIAFGRGLGLFLRRGATGRRRAPPSRRGRRWHHSPCRTSPRRSAAAWSRSTCWTRSASGSPSPRRRSLQRSRASSPDARGGWCAATGGGPTWVNAAWLLWMGMMRLGYARGGRRGWPTALAETVDREGLREYYHPRTGEGLGAPDFAWTSLALEMANPDPRAASSYL